MTDEVTNGQGEPKDDLRSALESAFSADFRASESAEQVRGPGTDETRLPDAESPRDDRDRPAAAADSAQMSESPSSPPKRGAPPPGWSIQSKAAFDGLPDPVKADIAKREEEISRGFAKLADYKGLDPWLEMAKSSGRTLPEVVGTYVAAEKLLNENFGDGILSLCRMYGADPAKLGQFLTSERKPAAADAAAPVGIAPVLDRLDSVDRRLTQWERQMAERERRQAATEIARFAADPAHKFFADVQQTMGEIHRLDPKMTLEDAYQQACWTNPEIRQLLISEQVEKDRQEGARKADQARHASASLPNGPPLPGASPNGGPAPTLRAELERAFEQARI